MRSACLLLPVLALCEALTAAPPPVIQSFTATPPAITSGHSATLAWNVAGASIIAMSGVTATPATSVVVTPAQTTTYILTATNEAGTVQQNLTVSVTSASPIASVEIDPKAAPQAIAPSFLGVCHSLSEVPRFIGVSSSQMNPIFEQLMRNILVFSNGPMIIALGDDANVGNHVDPNTLSAVAQLSQDLAALSMQKVNFGAGDVSLAADQAGKIAGALPAGVLQGIGLGNEADQYPKTGKRPADWGYKQYVEEFQRFAPAIIAAAGGIKLAAPGWAGNVPEFWTNLGSFIQSQRALLSMVDVHHYASGPGQQKDFLLTDRAATGGAVAVLPYIQFARQAGLPFRIGETNSISVGGQAGVSDTFQSALWLPDYAFEYARAGVSGINFYGSSTGVYSLYRFSSSTTKGISKYTLYQVNPAYYGALLFEQATQNQAQILPLTLKTSANIKAWSTIDTNGTIRLLLLNKDINASGAVTIQLHGYGQASVIRMTAPSFASTSGVVLEGQSFDGSADGTPQGTAYAEVVQASNGAYTVAVPSVSAALITATKDSVRAIPTILQVTNAASGAAGAVAPGEIVSIWGTELGPSASAGYSLTASGNISTNAANVRVTFDSVPAPITYVSATQINAIVPYEIHGRSNTRLMVTSKGFSSNTVELSAAASAPAVFTVNGAGSGPGAILNQDYVLNSAANPAARGSVVLIYATGAGQTDPPGTNGQITGATLNHPIVPVSVNNGGQAAQVMYAGSAPGNVSGLLQINAVVPVSVTSGTQPVLVTIGSAVSQPNVTVAVQ